MLHVEVAQGRGLAPVPLDELREFIDARQAAANGGKGKSGKGKKKGGAAKKKKKAKAAKGSKPKGQGGAAGETDGGDDDALAMRVFVRLRLPTVRPAGDGSGSEGGLTLDPTSTIASLVLQTGGLESTVGRSPVLAVRAAGGGVDEVLRVDWTHEVEVGAACGWFLDSLIALDGLVKVDVVAVGEEEDEDEEVVLGTAEVDASFLLRGGQQQSGWASVRLAKDVRAFMAEANDGVEPSDPELLVTVRATPALLSPEAEAHSSQVTVTLEAADNVPEQWQTVDGGKYTQDIKLTYDMPILPGTSERTQVHSILGAVTSTDALIAPQHCLSRTWFMDPAAMQALRESIEGGKASPFCVEIKAKRVPEKAKDKANAFEHTGVARVNLLALRKPGSTVLEGTFPFEQKREEEEESEDVFAAAGTTLRVRIELTNPAFAKRTKLDVAAWRSIHAQSSDGDSVSQVSQDSALDRFGEAISQVVQRIREELAELAMVNALMAKASSRPPSVAGSDWMSDAGSAGRASPLQMQLAQDHEREVMEQSSRLLVRGSSAVGQLSLPVNSPTGAAPLQRQSSRSATPNPMLSPRLSSRATDRGSGDDDGPAPWEDPIALLVYLKRSGLFGVFREQLKPVLVDVVRELSDAPVKDEAEQARALNRLYSILLERAIEQLVSGKDSDDDEHLDAPGFHPSLGDLAPPSPRPMMGGPELRRHAVLLDGASTPVPQKTSHFDPVLAESQLGRIKFCLWSRDFFLAKHYVEDLLLWFQDLDAVVPITEEDERLEMTHWHCRAWCEFAAMYNAMGLRSTAAQCYREALQRDSTNLSALVACGLLQCERERLVDARLSLMSAVRQHADEPLAWVALSLWHRLVEEDYEAEAAFNTARSLLGGEEMCEPHVCEFFLAHYVLDLSLTQLAERVLRGQLTATNSEDSDGEENAGSRNRLAMSDSDSDDDGEAATPTQRLIQLRRRVMFSRVYVLRHKHQRALQGLQLVQDELKQMLGTGDELGGAHAGELMGPTQLLAQTHAAMGEIYHSTHRRKEAIDSFERYLSLHRHHPRLQLDDEEVLRIRMSLGELLLECDQLERARAIFEGLVDNVRTRSSRAYLGLGRALSGVAAKSQSGSAGSAAGSEDGLNDEAEFALTQATAWDPENPHAWGALAQFYARRGLMDEAQLVMEQARRKGFVENDY